MSLRTRIASALAAIALLPAFSHAADLMAAIPSDTWVAVWVHDADEFREYWAKKYDPIWLAPETAKLRELVEKKTHELADKFEAEQHIRPEALFGLVKKSAVFCSTTLEAHKNGDSGGAPELDSIFMMEYSPDQKPAIDRALATLLEKVPANARKRSYELAGSTVYSIEFSLEEPADAVGDDGDDDAAKPGASATPSGATLTREIPMNIQYSFRPDVFVVAEGKGEPIRKVLPTLAGESGGGSLAGQEKFKRLLAESGGKPLDVNLYLDYDRILGVVEANASKKKNSDLPRKLGLRGTGPLLLGGGVGESGSRMQFTILVDEQKSGVPALLYGAMPAGNLSQLSNVPAEAGEVGTFTFDGEGFMRELRATLLAFSPEAFGGMNIALASMKGELGVDPEKDVINNIAGENLVYRYTLTKEQLAHAMEGMATSATDESNAAMVLSISVRNGAVLVDTLDRMFAKLTSDPEHPLPIEHAQEQGFSVYRMKKEGDAAKTAVIQPALALTPQALLVTFDDTHLQDALRRASGKGSGSILDNKEFSELLSHVDKTNIRSIGYTSAEMIAQKYGIARAAMKKVFAMASADKSIGEIIDALPPPELIRAHIGASFAAFYLRPTAIHAESELKIP